LLDARAGGRLEREPTEPGFVRVEVDLNRSPVFGAVIAGSSPWVFFLWSRQHSEQRHSTTNSPLSPRLRESRQPNCALISV
jgi:hypothetical protein